MNGGHVEALQLYAAHFAGETAGKWRAAGIDPEGLDLARGDACARVDFPRRVTDGAQLRQVLMEMADAARAAT